MLQKILALGLILSFSCTACATAASPPATVTPTATIVPSSALSTLGTATPTVTDTKITLSDSGVLVDGILAPETESSPVWVGADIVYYELGHDETYGEGSESDAHSAEDSQSHTVVTITEPGVYRVTGTLSAGQLAIDLGDTAKDNPEAVVTLVLDGVDITCTVAPAILFYSVYECGADVDATATVDTTAAGANIILSDGSINYISGSYVAKIYQEGTDKKLHKYDGAVYSKRSMNVSSDGAGTGSLIIVAENEGLCSDLHLTINSGILEITAQNDGINTSEDGLSVATINGGTITIDAGLGAEGDGIDSNGYLVINGGTVTAMANPISGDGGLDADLGIWLNGGVITGLGSRNDEIDGTSTQYHMELNFATAVPVGSVVSVKDSTGGTILELTARKDFQAAVLSGPSLALDTEYAVYIDGVQQQYTGTGSGGFGGGQRGMTPADGATRPEGGEPPARTQGQPQGTPPVGMEMPSAPPDGTVPSQGGRPNNGGSSDTTGTASTAFLLTAESKTFSGITAITA